MGNSESAVSRFVWSVMGYESYTHSRRDLRPSELERFDRELERQRQREREKRSRELVVTIDFGTNNSRYVFYVPRSGDRVSFEMPTIILFSPDGMFHSAGEDAAKKFNELSRHDRKVADWYLFEEFKMEISNAKDLTRHLPLLDFTKRKSLPAMTVFSTGIRFLKKHAERAMQEKGIREGEWEITWAVRVPGFWEDKAKSFMRAAAEEAGIPEDNVRLEAESEAAAKEIFEKRKDSYAMTPGTRFIAQDCGGGKTEATAYEVQHGKTLKQISPCVGSSTGGNQVDQEFEKLIFNLLGTEGIQTLAEHEVRDLRKAFQDAKRSQGNSDELHIDVPQAVLPIIEDNMSSHKSQAKGITVKGNKLVLEGELFRSLTKTTVQAITKNMDQVDSSQTTSAFGRGTSQIKKVYTSGNVCQSPIIKEKVKDANPNRSVECSDSAATIGISHKCPGAENPIIARMYSYTYGIAARLPFETGKHDPARRVLSETGRFMCEGCFHIHLHCNEQVNVNTVLDKQVYCPASSDQTALEIAIYRSTKRDPIYVSEPECKRIGSFTVPMPDTSKGLNREVTAALEIGGEELTLRTMYEGTLRTIRFSLSH